jgi:hypothetical protein
LASGSVTSISVNSSNGFAGTSSGGATPALTLSTTVTGILYGNGTSMSAATAGDFPTLNQNTTGTAANVTATTNSTITTLSALSLPYSQITGTPTPLVFADSLVNTSGTVTLVGDTATPGATQYYGTNGSSVLGYYNIPATGVTSVALALPVSVFTVSGSPVTSSGTLTGSFATQTANTVFAGPATGSAATPTFRALVSADIPNNAANTTGTASNITATTNATLTTLSALTTAGSLAISGSQVSGGTFGAVNGSALTNLSAAALSGVLPVGVTGGSGLSIATSQLTGDVSLTTQVSGILPIANGGTNASSAASAFANLSPLTTAGQIIYENATPAPAALNIGSTGQVLTVVGGLPAWATPATSGTVTSVAFADDSSTPIYAVSGSPVTSSGTLAITLNTQTANTVFAGPSSGSAAQPTFRALVSADIPNLSATYVLQSEVGAANGVASLDSGGKIPLSQLPATLMEFKGSWNPNTNTPTLVDGTGTTGYTYWVSAADPNPVAGLNDPSMYNFQIGDLVIYNGTAWVLVTPAAGVQSVNGAQGAVTVNAINQLTGDVTAGPASGSQSVVASLVATSNATLTTLSALTTASSLSSVGTITSGTWNGTAIAIAHGGTGQTTKQSAFDALSPLATAGDTLYYNGTHNVNLGIGSAGQVLTVVAGEPAWASPATSGTVTSVAFSVPASSIFGETGSPITSSGTIALTTTGTSGGIPYFSSTTQLSSSALLAANTIVVGGGAGVAPSSISAGLGTVNQVLHGNASGQPTWSAVAAGDLGTITDGITTDQNGAGSTIEVLSSPSVKRTVIAGQAFSANTTYAVRWGQPSQGETANRVYAADMSTSTTDRFWVVGVFNSPTSISIAGTLTMTVEGPLTLASGDTNFASGDQGYPVWLASAGAYAGNTAGESPGSGNASCKIGIAESATIIWVAIQMMGVN